MINSVSHRAKTVLFIALTLLCLWPVVTTPMALVAGLSFGIFFGCPHPALVQRFSKLLLQASVVGLGFGIGIIQVFETGKDSLPLALCTIGLALLLGFFLYRLFKTPASTSILISVGTAICGGSAIAAVAPIIRAKPEEISVSLAAVFTLNAAALFIFPWVSHIWALTPEQFGLWSALAIHDTSNVVGAASLFGEEALTLATTVKLTRVIWIVPIAFLLALLERRKGKIAIPWFVGLFLLAAVIKSTFIEHVNIFDTLFVFAKQSLCVVLFWIGAGLNGESLRSVGFRPFAFAILLWIVLAVVSFHIARL